MTTTREKPMDYMDFHELIEEARSVAEILTEDGVIEILEKDNSTRSGEQTGNFTVTKHFKLKIDLYDTNDIQDLWESMSRLTNFQIKCFILHKLCMLDIAEVAMRLREDVVKVDLNLKRAYSILF